MALRLSDLQTFFLHPQSKKKGANPDVFYNLPTFILFLLSFFRF